MDTITIAYQGQDYVVPLTTDSTQFYVQAVGGSSLTVPADVAANLFGAEKAVLLLDTLHNQQGFNDLTSDWQAVVTAAGEELASQGAEDFLAGVSGNLISVALTGGVSVEASVAGTAAALAASAAKVLPDLAQSEAPSLIDLGSTSLLLSNAITLLANANSLYQNQIASATGPIQFTTIQEAIDHTLLGFNLGTAAEQATRNIPGVSNSYWDDLEQIFTSVVSPLTDLANDIASVLSAAATLLQTKLLGNGSTLQSSIDVLGDLVGVGDQIDQLRFATSLLSALDDVIATSHYGPLTTNGVNAAITELLSNPSVQAGAPTNIYAITPSSPQIKETAGKATFTITRSDDSAAATVYVSTVQDQGITNTGNEYYQGIKNKAITFAAGQATATVKLTVNNPGVTIGSESFGLIVQQNSTDPITTYLARDVFTIDNTDVPADTGTYSITPASPVISENQGIENFTITRSDDTLASTVYVSTVHDQGSNNPNGEYYYDGLLNTPVSFAAGQSTATVPLTIEDHGLTSGSETFRIIVQQNSTDPLSAVLASDVFTIDNNNAPPPSSTVAISATASDQTSSDHTSNFGIGFSFGLSLDGVDIGATTPVVVPVVANASTAAEQWSNPTSWDGAFILLQGAADVSTVVGSVEAGNVVQAINQSTKTLTEFGPSNQASFTIPVAVFDIYGLPINFNVTLDIAYDVTIAAGALVALNQSDVDVNSLTINAGGSLTAGQYFVVANDLDNQGAFNAPGDGTIGGNLFNAGHAVISSLGVSGGVFNTGRINVFAGGELSAPVIASNSGAIAVAGTLSISNSAENDATGIITIDDGGTFDVPSQILNAGTIALDGSGSATELYIQYPDLTTLAGGGLVTLSDSADNYITGYYYPGYGSSELINQNNTIRGAGTIGYAGGNDTSLELVNEAAGVIDARGSNPLILSLAGGSQNQGIMQASSGGTLEIESSVDNTSGTIQALSGSTVEVVVGGSVTNGLVRAQAGGTVALDGGEVIGGTVSAASGGVIETGSGQAGYSDDTGYLDNVTITKGTNVIVQDGGTIWLGDTIANSGTIALAASSQTTELYVESTTGTLQTTLTGGGLVTLSDSADNYITGYYYPGYGLSELINQNNTIRGAGTIGYGPGVDEGLTLVNQSKGVIDGTGDTAALIINTVGTLINSGTLESTGGLQGLVIDSAVTNSGLLQATGTGLVTAYGAVTNHGTIATAGTGVLMIENSVVNTGSILANGGKLQITGSVTGSGQMQIGAGSTLELGANSGEKITFTGVATLQLDAPKSYTGAIAGLAAGDKIDLGGIAVATKIVVNGTRLVVTVSGGGTVALNTSGDLSGLSFTVAKDGTGLNSVITARAVNTQPMTIITASAPGQILAGSASFYDEFQGTTAHLNGDSISLFGGNDVIDLTNMGFAASSLTWSGGSSVGTLTVTDGTHSAAINLSQGSGYTSSAFSLAADGHGGTEVLFM